MSVGTATPAGANNSTVKTVALWVASGLLAFVFVMIGIAKFTNPEVAKQVARWGYPDWTRVLVAVVEIGGGLALLVPRTASYATGALGTVLAAAVFTHLQHGAVPHAAVPLVFLGLLMLVGYAHHLRALTQGGGRNRRSGRTPEGTPVLVLKRELREPILVPQRELIDAFFSIKGNAVWPGIAAPPGMAVDGEETWRRGWPQEYSFLVKEQGGCRKERVVP